jgi:hypothetical protein
VPITLNYKNLARHRLRKEGVCEQVPRNREYRVPEKQFLIQFGSELTDGSLNESSFLCAYYGWKINPNLGAMQGRWDSDLLVAHSFVLVSVALLAMGVVEGCIASFDLFLKVWLIVLVVILCGSFLAFKYHRKKRVYGRFGLFLTLTSHPYDKVEVTTK